MSKIRKKKNTWGKASSSWGQDDGRVERYRNFKKRELDNRANTIGRCAWTEEKFLDLKSHISFTRSWDPKERSFCEPGRRLQCQEFQQKSGVKRETRYISHSRSLPLTSLFIQTTSICGRTIGSLREQGQMREVVLADSQWYVNFIKYSLIKKHHLFLQQRIKEERVEELQQSFEVKSGLKYSF